MLEQLGLQALGGLSCCSVGALAPMHTISLVMGLCMAHAGLGRAVHGKGASFQGLSNPNPKP